MNALRDLGCCLLAALLTGCVVVAVDHTPSPDKASNVPLKSQPERLNVRIALDCLPTCALIGADLAQTTRIIVNAFRDSGRFSVVPSDEVSRVADVKVSVERQNDWLESKVCHATLGFIPAVWHDRVKMVTRFSGRDGAEGQRVAQWADIDYRCHLFLAPWVPFSEDAGTLDRTITELTRSTILQVPPRRYPSLVPVDLPAKSEAAIKPQGAR